MNESSDASAERLIEVFNEAKGRAVGTEREQFLAWAAGDDLDFRAEVEQLLRADEDGEGYLKMPTSVSRAPTIGGYEILGKLGEGGMGAVYRARQISFDRAVALKVLPAHLEDDPAYVSRFEREARVAANLRHENLVGIHAYGSVDGCHFIAMELIEGENLHQRLRRGTMDIAEALSVADYVARGLQCGWDQAQLVHRDIKPSNIYLSHEGLVKVGDLGLAKSLVSNTTSLTQSGTMMGTPHYMSPEQCRGEKALDFRADIYSLGCTLFEMLTGHPPYPGDDPIVIIRKHLDLPPPGLIKELPGCPIPLARLVGRMLKKAARERHSSYDELIEEIEVLYRQIEQGVPLTNSVSPWQARRVAELRQAPAKRRSHAPVWAGVGTLCAVGVGVGLWLNRPVETAPQTSLPVPALPSPTPEPALPRTPVPASPPPAASTPSPNPAEPAPAPPAVDNKTSIAPAASNPTPLPLRDLPADTVVTLAKDTQANSTFGASILKKGTKLKLMAVEENEVKVRLGSDVIKLPATDIIVPAVLPKPAPRKSLVPTATTSQPFENSLGMKFVPVPIVAGPTAGKPVLFSVWETRVQDYETFATETKREWPKPEFEQGPTHPAVMVNWEDATAFCAWLTERERRLGKLGPNDVVRLPSDYEWACANGIGEQEDAGKLPAEQKPIDGFPWGDTWPPPANTGNFWSEELPSESRSKLGKIKIELTGYRDGYAGTAPVGAFAANRFGLYDLAGNVMEFCEDWFDRSRQNHVMRGSSWRNGNRFSLRTAFRYFAAPDARASNVGFRPVVVLAGTGTASSKTPAASVRAEEISCITDLRTAMRP